MFGLHAEHENGFRPNAGFNLLQGHGRVVHELGSGVSIDGGVELHGADWNSAGFLSDSEFVRREYGIVSNESDGGFKRRAQERVSLRVIRGSLLWRSTAYATEGRWQLFLTIPPAGGRFEGSGSQTEEEDRRYGAGLTSAVTWLMPHGELTAGTEGRFDHSRYENYFTTARSRDSVLYGGDRLRVDLGARADVLDTKSVQDAAGESSASTGAFPPKVGALYRLTSSFVVYANLSRGFRASDGVIGDPALPFITAWAYESGFRYDRDDTHASAALFRMDVSKEQTFDPIARGSVSGGSSRRQGLEVELAASVASGVRVTGDWTFNDARYTHLTLAPEDPAEAPAVVSGLRVYNTSKYVGA